MAESVQAKNNNFIKPENKINNNDPLKRYNKVLIPLVVLGSLFGLIQGGIIGLVILLVASLGLLYKMPRAFIAIVKLFKIQRMKFSLNHCSKEYIKQSLQENFSCQDLIIDNTSDLTFVYKDSAKFKIKFDEKGEWFSIIPKQTLKTRMRHFGREHSESLYTDTVRAVPYIIYTIDNIVNKKI